MARAAGSNHIALEVGSLDEALAIYGRLFDVELRGRMRRDAVLAAAREAGVEIFGGNSLLDAWGNQAQVVAYEDIQFTKAAELRDKGLA